MKDVRMGVRDALAFIAGLALLAIIIQFVHVGGDSHADTRSIWPVENGK